jgi:hypothetical protein
MQLKYNKMKKVLSTSHEERNQDENAEKKIK